jgi:predicted nucleotidyltransferase
VQQLRLASHAQWLEQLRAKLNNFLLPSCAIYLVGSRARGDWDGYSDTDLLVVGSSQEMAEIQADKLRDGLLVMM